MAIVTYSVPDEVKAAFDKAFEGQNKSGVVAELMRRAVREAGLQRRRQALFQRLAAARTHRPSVTPAQLRRARAAGRS